MGIISGFMKYKALKRGLEVLFSLFRRSQASTGARRVTQSRVR